MALLRLDHYTLRSRDMEGTRDFYDQVFGLKPGRRPNLGFHGYWLYCGAQPVIHLIPAEGENVPADTGDLDHIAFLADDFGGMKAHFSALNLDFKVNDRPGGALRQLIVRDPNNVMIEMNFPRNNA